MLVMYVFVVRLIQCYGVVISTTSPYLKFDKIRCIFLLDESSNTGGWVLQQEVISFVRVYNFERRRSWKTLVKEPVVIGVEYYYQQIGFIDHCSS